MPGWVEERSEETGQLFYHNEQLNMSSWFRADAEDTTSQDDRKDVESGRSSEKFTENSLSSSFPQKSTPLISPTEKSSLLDNNTDATSARKPITKHDKVKVTIYYIIFYCSEPS